MYDKTDKKVLAALRSDSSKRLLQYAARTGVPKSTFHERLQKLLRSGVRCVPLLHWQRIGYPITVCFFVPYRDGLLESPHINTAQRVSPDLLYIEAIFSTMKEVEEFKAALTAARYFTVIEVLKREGFVPPL